MRTIQHSIDVQAPASVVYKQLARFEEYPRFMRDVEAVWQIDASHLRWITRIGNRRVEWDAEITEQQPDQCIGWYNMGRISDSGRLDMRALGPDTTQVTFTLQSAQIKPGVPDQESSADMGLRIRQSLARLKDWVELGYAETDPWRSDAHEAALILRERAAKRFAATGALGGSGKRG